MMGGLGGGFGGVPSGGAFAPMHFTPPPLGFGGVLPASAATGGMGGLPGAAVAAAGLQLSHPTVRLGLTIPKAHLGNFIGKARALPALPLPLLRVRAVLTPLLLLAKGALLCNAAFVHCSYFSHHRRPSPDSFLLPCSLIPAVAPRAQAGKYFNAVRATFGVELRVDDSDQSLQVDGQPASLLVVSGARDNVWQVKSARLPLRPPPSAAAGTMAPRWHPAHASTPLPKPPLHDYGQRRRTGRRPLRLQLPHRRLPRSSSSCRRRAGSRGQRPVGADASLAARTGGSAAHHRQAGRAHQPHPPGQPLPRRH